MAALRKRSADAAEADDADGFAGDFGADHMRRPPAAPFAGTQLAFPFPAAARYGQQQQHGDVGGAVGQYARRIGDDDALLLGGSDVDVIEADSEIAEDFRPDSIALEKRSRQSVGNGRQHRIIGQQSRAQLPGIESDIIQIERRIEAFGKYGLNCRRPAPGDENTGSGHAASSPAKMGSDLKHDRCEGNAVRRSPNGKKPGQ